MARHVRKVQVLRADQLHGRALEHPVVLLADIARVLNRFMDYIVRVLYSARGKLSERWLTFARKVTYGTGADDPNVVFMGGQSVKRHV